MDRLSLLAYFAETLAIGARVTVIVALGAITLALVGGCLFYAAGRAPTRWVTLPARAAVALFRTVPVLTQLFLI